MPTTRPALGFRPSGATQYKDTMDQDDDVVLFDPDLMQAAVVVAG